MRKILAFIVIMLTTISLSWGGMVEDAVKRGTLKVGLTPTYMPFEMTNKKGDIIGFEVDIVRAMAKAMGVKLELIPVSYDGIIPGLLTGKFDLIASGMTINQSRNIRVNFTDSFITTGQTLLIRKELVGVINSYKDLNHEKYKITSQTGTTGEFIAKKYLSKAAYYGYNSEAEALLEVANGRADAFIFDEYYNVVALQKLGKAKVAHLEKLITKEPIAFAIQKGDYDSINWINSFLNQIKNDGSYDYIYNKWFKRMDWLKDME